MNSLRNLFFALVSLVAFITQVSAYGECNNISNEANKRHCMLQHLIYRDNSADISQVWRGQGEAYGGDGLHAGIDVRAGYHVPFRAVAGGQVVRVGDGIITIYVTNTSYGYPTNGHPVLHKYGHGENFKFTEGQTVYAGQVLGETACNGYCFGNHTHFEVELSCKKGNSNDPSACTSQAWTFDEVRYKRFGQDIAQMAGTSKVTLDPLKAVFGSNGGDGMRNQGGWNWTQGIPNYAEANQGQDAKFTVNVWPGNYFNMPLRFEAKYLPQGYDSTNTKWSLLAVSASDWATGQSIFTIRPTNNTPPGTYWMDLEAIATDGTVFSNWVALSVKQVSAGGGGVSNQTILTDCQTRASTFSWMSGRQSDNVEFQSEDSSYTYKRVYYNTCCYGQAIVIHATSKTDQSVRWTQVYVANYNWYAGWIRV